MRHPADPVRPVRPVVPRRIISEDEEGEAGWPHIFLSGSLVELDLDLEIHFLQAKWRSVQIPDRGPPCRLRSSQWGSAHSVDYRFTSRSSDSGGLQLGRQAGVG